MRILLYKRVAYNPPGQKNNPYWCPFHVAVLEGPSEIKLVSSTEIRKYAYSPAYTIDDLMSILERHGINLK
jgi:hypothetical protein